MEQHPVVVIGAGPIGLAAAAHLLERGLEPVVLESGAGPAAAVERWGHVRLFSAWPELIDAAAARLLTATGWVSPSEGYPTGAEWVEHYLAPLAVALGERVRYGARVVGVARHGRDLMTDHGRDERPFVVQVHDAAGGQARVIARAVLDASGTWSSPNPAGADGLPAAGEESAGDLLLTAIPDRRQPDRHAGRHTVVLGAGHSAFTAVSELRAIADAHPGTRITWAIRRGVTASTFGGAAADALPERGALGMRARDAVESGAVEFVAGFRVAEMRRAGDRAVLIAQDGREIAPADAVVVLTGYRPDLSFLTEVRLDLDPRIQSPRRLATEIDPNVHSCGTVRATGAADLAQPERDFYPVGMKSYGRAPTFLAMTGYEQVRSVAAALAGDREAASRVELMLPPTGVCGGSGVLEDGDGAAAGGCCGAPSPIPLTVASR